MSRSGSPSPATSPSHFSAGCPLGRRAEPQMPLEHNERHKAEGTNEHLVSVRKDHADRASPKTSSARRFSAGRARPLAALYHPQGCVSSCHSPASGPLPTRSDRLGTRRSRATAVGIASGRGADDGSDTRWHRPQRRTRWPSRRLQRQIRSRKHGHTRRKPRNSAVESSHFSPHSTTRQGPRHLPPCCLHFNTPECRAAEALLDRRGTTDEVGFRRHVTYSQLLAVRPHREHAVPGIVFSCPHHTHSRDVAGHVPAAPGSERESQARLLSRAGCKSALSTNRLARPG